MEAGQAVSRLDKLLASYAAGALPSALHALVGGHLELSDANRHYVHSLESSLAQAVDVQPEAPVKRRDARLDAIFACDKSGRRASDEIVPRALQHVLNVGLETLAYRETAPGVREADIPDSLGTPAHILRMQPGAELPLHTHHTAEYMLILKGGCTAGDARFVRGDIAIFDEKSAHSLVANCCDECICLAVLDTTPRL